MSHLKEIMYARGVSLKDLALLADLTYPTVWGLIKDDRYEFAQKKTQQKIAAVLGVTVRDIIYGKDAEKITEEEKAKVKKKIVEAEVIKATEHLLLVLRNYYPEPVHLHMTIFTKDADDLDYYDARVDDTTEELPENRIIVDKTAMVKFGEDGKILETIPYYKRGEKNE